MPTNLYGPGDNFDLENSHVLPALIRRFHEAKLRGDPQVVAWGTGTPRREFLHVADLADAIVMLLERYDDESIINVGCGADVSIRELCEIVVAVTGYEGRLEFDDSRADGTPRKLLDVSRISALGWQPRISLRTGIEQVYAWFRANTQGLRL
jgi:GDP-L-fucose synthase